MLDERKQIDETETIWRQGRRISIREMMIWLTVISAALAIPIGLDLPLLPVIFYGTLGSLLWRLSKAMPLNLAALIAVVVAVGVTCICIPLLPP